MATLDWSYKKSRGVKRRDNNTWWQEKLMAKKQKKLMAKSKVEVEEGSDQTDLDEAEADPDSDIEWIEPKVSARELLMEHEEASGYTFTSSGSGMARGSQAPGPKAPGSLPAVPKAPEPKAPVEPNLDAPVEHKAPELKAFVAVAPVSKASVMKRPAMEVDVAPRKRYCRKGP